MSTAPTGPRRRRLALTWAGGGCLLVTVIVAGTVVASSDGASQPGPSSTFAVASPNPSTTPTLPTPSNGRYKPGTAYPGTSTFAEVLADLPKPPAVRQGLGRLLVTAGRAIETHPDLFSGTWVASEAGGDTHCAPGSVATVGVAEGASRAAAARALTDMGLSISHGCDPSDIELVAGPFPSHRTLVQVVEQHGDIAGISTMAMIDELRHRAVAVVTTMSDQIRRTVKEKYGDLLVMIYDPAAHARLL